MSKLNAANWFKATNTFAVLVITYSFHVTSIYWKITKIKKLDTEITYYQKNALSKNRTDSTFPEQLGEGIIPSYRNCLQNNHDRAKDMYVPKDSDDALLKLVWK